MLGKHRLFYFRKLPLC